MGTVKKLTEVAGVCFEARTSLGMWIGVGLSTDHVCYPLTKDGDGRRYLLLVLWSYRLHNFLTFYKAPSGLFSLYNSDILPFFPPITRFHPFEFICLFILFIYLFIYCNI